MKRAEKVVEHKSSDEAVLVAGKAYVSKTTPCGVIAEEVGMLSRNRTTVPATEEADIPKMINQRTEDTGSIKVSSVRDQGGLAIGDQNPWRSRRKRRALRIGAWRRLSVTRMYSGDGRRRC